VVIKDGIAYASLPPPEFCNGLLNQILYIRFFVKAPV